MQSNRTAEKHAGDDSRMPLLMVCAIDRSGFDWSDSIRFCRPRVFGSDGGFRSYGPQRMIR